MLLLLLSGPVVGRRRHQSVHSSGSGRGRGSWGSSVVVSDGGKGWRASIQSSTPSPDSVERHDKSSVQHEQHEQRSDGAEHHVADGLVNDVVDWTEHIRLIDNFRLHRYTT